MAANIDKQIADLERILASGVERAEAPDAVTLSYRKYDDLRKELSRLYMVKAAGASTSGSVTTRRTRQIVTRSRSGW